MKKVLIVDDSRFMRAMVKEEVKNCGFEVCGEASCSQDAVKLYQETHPDLVTMDITMTVDGHTVGRSSNGIDAISEIIEIDPKAKILCVSAMGQRSFVVEAIQAGAADYITKPFNPVRLQETLERLLKD